MSSIAREAAAPIRVWIVEGTRVDHTIGELLGLFTDRTEALIARRDAERDGYRHVCIEEQPLDTRLWFRRGGAQ